MSFGTEFLDEITGKDNSKKPSNVDMVKYIFWEKGIDYTQFKVLPIPYILTILNTHNWVKSEEEKAYNKSNRKG